MRAGKQLPVTATEALVASEADAATHVFGHRPDTRATNYLRFRLGPEVEIALGAQVKAAGRGHVEPVELLACWDKDELREPYDVLLSNALAGDTLLFASAEEVEAQWAIVEPTLNKDAPLCEYAPAHGGPPRRAKCWSSWAVA